MMVAIKLITMVKSIMLIMSRTWFITAVRSSLQAMCKTSSPSSYPFFFYFICCLLALFITHCWLSWWDGERRVSCDTSFIIYDLSLIACNSSFTACLEFKDKAKNSIRNLNSFNEVFNFHKWYRPAHLKLHKCQCLLRSVRTWKILSHSIHAIVG